MLLPGLSFGQSQKDETEGNITPELAGAIRADGSTLVDGRLPRPFVDYVIELTTVRRTMTLFYSGLVVVTTTHRGNSFAKKILIPPDSIDSYREVISYDRFVDLSDEAELGSPTGGRETIRVYREDGEWAQKTFDASRSIASNLEIMRGLMKDLMRVISEDKDISNPMIGYEPLVGDQLLTEDFTAYRVLRVDPSAGIVEVHGVDDPIRMFVAWKDLETRFVGYSRTPTKK